MIWSLQEIVRQYENVRRAEDYPTEESESTKKAKKIIAKLGEVNK